MLQEQTILPMGAIIQGSTGERYVIEALLGQGGFSAVYRVREREGRQKTFAIKEMIDPNPQERRNLAFEAELLMRLDYPSLPRVYQVFETTKLNRLFMVMDFIDGKNLEVLRKEQPEQRFSLSVALTLMTPVVEAVTYLHTRKRPIVHRDIKPANIIVPSGAADTLLVDFGLAKEYIEDNTTSVFRYGTPGYAAPEQYGQGTNPRTDIYALGATLYTLLTGAVPADALTRSVNQLDNDPYQSVDVLCPSIPGHVARIIDRAMSLRHEKRFASAEEFWRVLCIAATQEKVGIPSDTMPTVLLPEGTQKQANSALASSQEPVKIKVIREKSRFSSQQKKFLFILFIIILVAASIDGIFIYTLHLQQATSRGNTIHTAIQQSATSTPTTAIISPPPAYPQLSSSYSGSITDIGVTQTETNMFLTEVQQQDNQINGTFNGLGQYGQFTGTVTKQGHLQFSVSIQVQDKAEILKFEGDLNVGAIAATWEGFYTDGSKTGDYGPFTLQPDKKSSSLPKR